MGISAIVFGVSKSIASAITAFIVGVFIDVDHLWDYYKHAGLSWDTRDFFDVCENYRMKKLRLFFHSYEILLPLWICICFTRFSEIGIGGLVGFVQHMIFDQLFNPTRPLTYFFIFRLKKEFNTSKIFNLKEQA